MCICRNADAIIALEDSHHHLLLQLLALTYQWCGARLCCGLLSDFWSISSDLLSSSSVLVGLPPTLHPSLMDMQISKQYHLLPPTCAYLGIFLFIVVHSSHYCLVCPGSPFFYLPLREPTGCFLSSPFTVSRGVSLQESSGKSDDFPLFCCHLVFPRSHPVFHVCQLPFRSHNLFPSQD